MNRSKENFVYRETAIERVDEVLSKLRDILLSEAVSRAKNEHLYRDRKHPTERFIVLPEHVMSIESLAEFIHNRGKI